MASINSDRDCHVDRDRRWWVPAAVVVPVLVLAALIDGVMLFMLLWAVSDGCDPQGPANDEAWHQVVTAAGIAAGLACAGFVGTFAVPHRRSWRFIRRLVAVLAVAGSLWPTVWVLLAYQQVSVHFTGCH